MKFKHRKARWDQRKEMTLCTVDEMPRRQSESELIDLGTKMNVIAITKALMPLLSYLK